MKSNKMYTRLRGKRINQPYHSNNRQKRDSYSHKKEWETYQTLKKREDKLMGAWFP
jgi:hypothetical protein